ncbi:flagellar filament capping protein FliD [Gephyromycinifex aptenodytis]|uniref:flagellar filament capping protein FliD n=1 Tax=Gephyromycinifex aptenodytis TaxID=2716227 RepID=UPI0014480757|nr:flagellar filament capping protein FliD [Gephyromycinifex aptenodytis]
MQISGLGSGIDTSSMVKQLMSVERLAGRSYTQGKVNSQALVSAFTSLNSKMKSLGEAANAFVPKSVLDKSAWASVAAKSSNEDIAKVSTSDKAQTGTLTFTVQQIAQAGTTMAGKGFSADEVVNKPNGEAFDFNINIEVTGEPSYVKVGADAKLADVVAAINQQAGADVKATMVQVESGTYKLQIQSATTGSKSNVHVTNGSTPPVISDVLGKFAQVAEGKDTVLHIGDANNGYDVKSSTKEVKDLLPGVTIKPVKADPTTPVTVDLSADAAGMADKVEAMIKSANEALSNIKINSGYNKDNPTASGPFVGDSTTRDLTNSIREAIVGGFGVNPAGAGISVDKAGTITFDRAKFTESYGKDPETVQKTVNGVATKLGQVAERATDSNHGLITVRIQGEQASIKDYSQQISRFEDRMSMRQQTLEAQFGAMESLLSKMQSQGSWLSGQLATLPTGN